MKKFFKLCFALILGVLFSGAIDPDDLLFQRRIKKLNKEKWFKDLSGNGRYYESIYQNEELKEYLLQPGIVGKIKTSEEEKERLLSFIKRNF